MQHNGDDSLKTLTNCLFEIEENTILCLIHFPVSLGASRSIYSVGSLNLSQNERIVSLCIGCV